MPSFAENLSQMPSIDHLSALELLDEQGAVVATIPNQPGKAGSLRLYAALVAEYGALTPAAAEKGLTLFAEHTADAQQHPGSHPNIDRLIELIATGRSLQARLIAA